MSETLNLIRLGPSANFDLDRLSLRLSARLHDFTIQVSEPLDTPEMAFDSSRKQYHSTRILATLEEKSEAGAGRVLAVTSFDLYVPGMNYVFGEARCPGRVAVISTYRLNTNRLELLEARVVKEAVHETGHMLGLRHCTRHSCVMYFSEQLADTDRKMESFCSECEGKMKMIEVE